MQNNSSLQNLNSAYNKHSKAFKEDDLLIPDKKNTSSSYLNVNKDVCIKTINLLDTKIFDTPQDEDNTNS